MKSALKSAEEVNISEVLARETLCLHINNIPELKRIVSEWRIIAAFPWRLCAVVEKSERTDQEPHLRLAYLFG